MSRRPPWRASALSAAVVWALAAAGPAAGDRAYREPSDPEWRAECGGCHVAYPPRFLSRSDWQSVMDALARHFGADASLDAATATRITAFLVANAGRERSGTGARNRGGGSGATGGLAGTVVETPRITTTAWFRHEHHEVGAAAWRAAAVTSPANCGACHPGAERGAFAEQDVRVPGPTGRRP